MPHACLTSDAAVAIRVLHEADLSAVIPPGGVPGSGCRLQPHSSSQDRQGANAAAGIAAMRTVIMRLAATQPTGVPCPAELQVDRNEAAATSAAEPLSQALASTRVRNSVLARAILAKREVIRAARREARVRLGLAGRDLPPGGGTPFGASVASQSLPASPAAAAFESCLAQVSGIWHPFRRALRGDASAPSVDAVLGRLSAATGSQSFGLQVPPVLPPVERSPAEVSVRRREAAGMSMMRCLGAGRSTPAALLPPQAVAYARSFGYGYVTVPSLRCAAPAALRAGAGCSGSGAAVGPASRYRFCAGCGCELHEGCVPQGVASCSVCQWPLYRDACRAMVREREHWGHATVVWGGAVAAAVARRLGAAIPVQAAESSSAPHASSSSSAAGDDRTEASVTRCALAQVGAAAVTWSAGTESIAATLRALRRGETGAAGLSAAMGTRTEACGRLGADACAVAEAMLAFLGHEEGAEADGAEAGPRASPDGRGLAPRLFQERLVAASGLLCSVRDAPSPPGSEAWAGGPLADVFERAGLGAFVVRADEAMATTSGLPASPARVARFARVLWSAEAWGTALFGLLPVTSRVAVEAVTGAACEALQGREPGRRTPGDAWPRGARPCPFPGFVADPSTGLPTPHACDLDPLCPSWEEVDAACGLDISGPLRGVGWRTRPQRYWGLDPAAIGGTLQALEAASPLLQHDAALAAALTIIVRFLCVHATILRSRLDGGASSHIPPRMADWVVAFQLLHHEGTAMPQSRTATRSADPWALAQELARATARSPCPLSLAQTTAILAASALNRAADALSSSMRRMGEPWAELSASLRHFFPYYNAANLKRPQPPGLLPRPTLHPSVSASRLFQLSMYLPRAVAEAAAETSRSRWHACASQAALSLLMWAVARLPTRAGAARELPERDTRTAEARAASVASPAGISPAGTTLFRNGIGLMLAVTDAVGGPDLAAEILGVLVEPPAGVVAGRLGSRTRGVPSEVWADCVGGSLADVIRRSKDVLENSSSAGAVAGLQGQRQALSCGDACSIAIELVRPSGQAIAGTTAARVGDALATAVWRGVDRPAAEVGAMLGPALAAADPALARFASWDWVRACGVLRAMAVLEQATRKSLNRLHDALEAVDHFSKQAGLSWQTVSAGLSLSPGARRTRRLVRWAGGDDDSDDDDQDPDSAAGPAAAEAARRLARASLPLLSDAGRSAVGEAIFHEPGMLLLQPQERRAHLAEALRRDSLSAQFARHNLSSQRLPRAAALGAGPIGIGDFHTLLLRAASAVRAARRAALRLAGGLEAAGPPAEPDDGPVSRTTAALTALATHRPFSVLDLERGCFVRAPRLRAALDTADGVLASGAQLRGRRRDAVMARAGAALADLAALAAAAAPTQHLSHRHHAGEAAVQGRPKGLLAVPALPSRAAMARLSAVLRRQAEALEAATRPQRLAGVGPAGAHEPAAVLPAGEQAPAPSPGAQPPHPGPTEGADGVGAPFLAGAVPSDPLRQLRAPAPGWFDRLAASWRRAGGRRRVASRGGDEDDDDDGSGVEDDGDGIPSARARRQADAAATAEARMPGSGLEGAGCALPACRGLCRPGSRYCSDACGLLSAQIAIVRGLQMASQARSGGGAPSPAASRSSSPERGTPPASLSALQPRPTACGQPTGPAPVLDSAPLAARPVQQGRRLLRASRARAPVAHATMPTTPGLSQLGPLEQLAALVASWRLLSDTLSRIGAIGKSGVSGALGGGIGSAESQRFRVVVDESRGYEADPPLDMPSAPSQEAVGLRDALCTGCSRHFSAAKLPRHRSACGTMGAVSGGQTLFAPVGESPDPRALPWFCATPDEASLRGKVCVPAEALAAPSAVQSLRVPVKLHRPCCFPLAMRARAVPTAPQHAAAFAAEHLTQPRGWELRVGLLAECAGADAAACLVDLDTAASAEPAEGIDRAAVSGMWPFVPGPGCRVRVSACNQHWGWDTSLVRRLTTAKAVVQDRLRRWVSEHHGDAALAGRVVVAPGKRLRAARPAAAAAGPGTALQAVGAASGASEAGDTSDQESEAAASPPAGSDTTPGEDDALSDETESQAGQAEAAPGPVAAGGEAPGGAQQLGAGEAAGEERPAKRGRDARADRSAHTRASKRKFQG